MQLTAAALIGLMAVALILIRRRRLGTAAAILLASGTLCLIAATGKFVWQSADHRSIAVMADFSPSTRGAAYRNTSILQHRIGELLGNTPYKLFLFSDRNVPADSSITEMPSERTVFSPVPADAILLFSDGRFSSPDHSPPVFPVLDPLLENTTDAAITGMEYLGDQLAVTVANNGPPRMLTLHGVAGPTTQMIAGDQTVLRPLAQTGERIWAELSPGDAWPENDSMLIPPPPALPGERWWIGNDAPDGWRALSPAELPTDPVAYLAPAVIVLNNLAADDLPMPAQQRLEQYVRDLGGSLVILGGNRAFAAGGYPGTILEALSPMSSFPPTPQTQWVLLADASGSMSQPLSDGPTRWDKVSHAMVDLLPHLPPADLVRVGQFSDTLKWWSDGLPAAQTALLPLPPPDAQPHGPTNLEPALDAIIAAHSGAPTQLILMTDADVDISDPDALARRLAAAHIRLHLLAIERGSGIAQLEDIVHDTGGSFITQLDSSQWAASMRRLLSAAAPMAVADQPATVNFTGEAAAIPAATAFPWNPTWIKPDATPIAKSNDRILAAKWRFGAGQVLAAAFAAGPTQATALADLIAQPPSDPRLKVSWQTTPAINVTVDAVDGKRYLNDLDLQIEIWDQSSATRETIAQTGPGRYELSLPQSARPAVATVRQGDRILARHALAGRYTLEFAAIGEDRGALQSLANTTGGRVIPPDQDTPIDFNWPLIPHPLTPWFSGAAAILLLAGLVATRF
jgi:hypothetical protein